MGIRVVWDNDKKSIIRYIYENRWSWEDLYTARLEVKAMLESVSHKVGIIVDVRNASILPNGTLSRAKHIASSSPTLHHNEGITVILGAGGLVRSIYDVMLKIYRDTMRERKYYFASSLEEAHSILTKQLSSVP
jgi:hypothetical protein